MIDGLPDKPQIQADLWSLSIPGTVTTLAIRDSGDLFLVGSSDGERGQVISVTLLGVQRMIKAFGNPASAAFLDDGHKAIVADLAKSEIVVINELIGENGVREFPTKGNLVFVPKDAHEAFIANTDSGLVTLLSLDTGSQHSAVCRCHPASLQQLSAEKVCWSHRSKQPSVASI